MLSPSSFGAPDCEILIYMHRVRTPGTSTHFCANAGIVKVEVRLLSLPWGCESALRIETLLNAHHGFLIISRYPMMHTAASAEIDRKIATASIVVNRVPWRCRIRSS